MDRELVGRRGQRDRRVGEMENPAGGDGAERKEGKQRLLDGR
jgi:hypothetical protein